MVARQHEDHMHFHEVVSSAEALRAIVGEPTDTVRRKDIGRLDRHARGFIARSPFALLATSGADGRCDVSPRGDRPGFAQVLDEHTLVIPERPGNRRLDSLSNIIENPHAGLIFLVPGWEDTLRVNGGATIIRDADVLARCAVDGTLPLLAVAVHVEECYIHCPKAFRRAHLWDTSAWVPRESFTSMAEIARDQLCLTEYSIAELSAQIERSNQRLY